MTSTDTHDSKSSSAETEFAPEVTGDSSAADIADADSVCCWICLGTDAEASTCGPLICPCACRGTQQVCHRGCLEKWLKTRVGAAEDSGRSWFRRFIGPGLDRYGGTARALAQIRRGSADKVSLESLSCAVCGERYSIRASSLKELSYRQWLRLVKSVAASMAGTGILFATLYLKLMKRMMIGGLNMQLGDLTRQGKGRAKKEEGGGYPSSRDWLLYVSVALFVVKMAIHIYSQIALLREEVRAVRAESLRVEAPNKIQKAEGTSGDAGDKPKCD